MNNSRWGVPVLLLGFAVFALNGYAMTPSGGTQIMAAVIGAVSNNRVTGSQPTHPSGLGVASTTSFGACKHGHTYADGCASAPVAPIQYPHLLDGYIARAPWNVAGVDYAVGIPSSTQLTDWTTFSHAGCSVENDANHHWIRCDDQTDLDVSGVDFSTGGGAILYLNNDANTIVEDSKFGGEYLAGVPYAIQMAGTSSGLTVRDNLIDTGGSAAMISAICGPIVFEYNHTIHQQQQVIQVGANVGSCNTSIAYKYNLLDDGAIISGAHLNYQQLQNNTIDSDVEFNTSYETSLGGAEGFQFYCVGTCTVHSPTDSNNTMIAIPNSGKQTMSYFMHGSSVDSGGHTTLTGTATSQNNYFDITGAYGAFYPSSFTGWTLATNTNMTDGSLFSNNP